MPGAPDPRHRIGGFACHGRVARQSLRQQKPGNEAQGLPVRLASLRDDGCADCFVSCNALSQLAAEPKGSGGT